MDDNIFAILKKELPGVKKNESLKNHTTFRIGGPAEYFLLAKKEQEILEAIIVAKKLKIPLFVMGGGSNLLVADKGIKGLVVKNQVTTPIVLRKNMQSIFSSRVRGSKSRSSSPHLLENNIVEAPAGAVLGSVVDFSISKSLQGLEWAGGLPGTFGGAIRGNAGAFGGETKDAIFKVKALDNNFNVRNLSNKQSQFSYRSSIFKKKNWVVLSATVKLKKGNKKDLQAIANSHINYRKEKHPLEYPNAGSIFKNVDFKKVPKKFQNVFADKVKQDPFPIVPAAWFIIGAGLAGKKIGQAQISTKHSNYIVNLGNATAQDVLSLIEFVKKKVKIKYGILLEQEVQYLK
mgnify:CR=1 FL=1